MFLAFFSLKYDAFQLLVINASKCGLNTSIIISRCSVSLGENVELSLCGGMISTTRLSTSKVDAPASLVSRESSLSLFHPHILSLAP